jgi:hypothetical protein
MYYTKELKEKKIEREIMGEENKLDLNLFKKQGNATTYKGYLISELKRQRDMGRFDIALLVQHFYKKYLEFEKHEEVILKSWRGKSGVRFEEKPEIVICIRHRKADRTEEAKEVKIELERQEINRVLKIISDLNEGEFIDTSVIAEKYYGKDWHSVFSTRKQHIKLVEILNYLEYKGNIYYSRRGKIRLLKEKQNG